MARPLSEFLAHLPKDTLSLAIRIGIRENPKDAGYVNLADWGAPDALDVAGLETELRERFEGGGWPADWPTVKIEAKPEAGGAGKMSTSWQDTGGRAKGSDAPSGPADAYMAATALASHALDVMASSLSTALQANAYAQAEVTNARAEAEAARLEAMEATQAANIAALNAELSEAGNDPNMERGASALERLGEKIIDRFDKNGGAMTEEELIASMEAAPDFVDNLFNNPKAEAIIQAAMLRKAAAAAKKAATDAPTS